MNHGYVPFVNGQLITNLNTIRLSNRRTFYISVMNHIIDIFLTKLILCDVTVVGHIIFVYSLLTLEF